MTPETRQLHLAVKIREAGRVPENSPRPAWTDLRRTGTPGLITRDSLGGGGVRCNGEKCGG